MASLWSPLFCKRGAEFKIAGSRFQNIGWAELIIGTLVKPSADNLVELQFGYAMPYGKDDAGAYANGDNRGENEGYRKGAASRAGAAKQPALLAYAVDEDQGEKRWTRVGRMFPHSDGKGFVVLLAAMPCNNRIVIREEQRKPRAAAKSAA